MRRLFSPSDNASVILPSRSIKKDGRIIVADLQEDEQLITELCIDPKGQRYMVGFDAGSVVIYENGKLIQFNCELENNSSQHSITALTFINENLIAAACNKQIYLFNTLTAQCIGKLTGHTAVIWSLAVSNKGDLFSASTDKTVRIWNIMQLTCKSVVENYQYRAHNSVTDFLVNICRYSPLLKNTFNYLTGYILLADREDWVSCLLPLSNGNVICGTKDAVIALLDENGCCKMEVKAGEKQKWNMGVDWYGATHQHITGFIEHSQVVISSSRDGTVRIWDKTYLQLKQKLLTPDHPQNNKIQSIAAIDNYLIAFSSQKEKLYIWDMATWKCEKIISGLSMVTNLAVTGNDEILLTYSSLRQRKAENRLYSIPLHTCLRASDNLEVTLDSFINPSNEVRNILGRQ